MKTVDFRTSGYFSGTIIFLGVVLMFAGAFVAIQNTYAGIAVFVVCLIIFTTHYRIKVDLSNKSYHDYLWILGVKLGDKGKFENIEYLYVTKNNVSQKMQLRGKATTIRKEVFNGFLKFSGEDKIHIATKDKKSDLVKKLSWISAALNVKIVDHTNELALEV